MPMATTVCVNSIAAKFHKVLVWGAEKEANPCVFIGLDIAKKHAKHVKLVMYGREVL